MLVHPRESTPEFGDTEHVTAEKMKTRFDQNITAAMFEFTVDVIVKNILSVYRRQTTRQVVIQPKNYRHIRVVLPLTLPSNQIKSVNWGETARHVAITPKIFRHI